MTTGMDRDERASAPPRRASSAPGRASEGGELRELRAQLAQEIGERRRLESELHQKQKLESVGELAEGIAHEINTPTQYVSDNVHFLAEALTTLEALRAASRAVALRFVKAEDQPQWQAALDALEDESDVAYLAENAPKSIASALGGLERITRLVAAMKEHGHRDGASQADADLNRILTTTLEVARNEYKYVADVETDLGDLPPVRCFGGELHQVFLNLVVNAAHAVAEAVGASGERGVIRVRSVRCEDEVVVAIEDTGSGIPESVRGRIFERFFSTKEVGRGSGQGLAIARDVVVDRHGGAIELETEVGRGTTFFVRLPIDGAAVAGKPG